MGRPTKEQEDEVDVQQPYEHPKKRTILKEPPVVTKGEIPMKKIKESLAQFNQYYSLKEADKIIEEMCGKKHTEELENDIENVPEKDMKKQLDNVENDIAEMKQIMSETIIEMTLNEKEYKDYFRSMMKQYGVTSPAQLSTEKKKKFFKAVSAGWKKEKKK